MAVSDVWGDAGIEPEQAALSKKVTQLQAREPALRMQRE